MNKKSISKKKTILIDTSLTGGRGPAKKTYEFVQRCNELEISYKLLTNSEFAFKLKDMNLKVDYTIDVSLSSSPEKILQEYKKTLSRINYDSLIRFGARNPGPTQARLSEKPYVIVDGGLPDKMEKEPSLYDQDTFKKACKYIVTTQFPWKFSLQLNLDNVEVGFFTLSAKTINFIRKLRNEKKETVLKKLIDKQPQLKLVRDKKYLFINLLMTSNYVTNPFDRVTYGAWLKSKEFDACVGFLRRLVTDLGIKSKVPVILFVDQKIQPVIQDLTGNHKQIQSITYSPKWDYDTEILITKVADINISRATNYQPFVALLGNGGSITTPVPADGYMDEDTAAYQYQALNMTEVIEYDDEFYVDKLIKFAQDQQKQMQISDSQIKVSDNFLSTANSADMALSRLVVK